MRRKKKKKNRRSNSVAVFVILFIAAFAVTTCSRRITEDAGKPAPGKTSHKKNNRTGAARLLLAEDFEAGAKTSYNNGNVMLASGRWQFKNAVTGNLEADHKTGKQALRIRSNGTAGMDFDVAAAGTVTVTLKYALYGKDKNGTWELWASVNRGQSYFRVGETVSTVSALPRTAVFTVKTTGAIRFTIRKTDRQRGRINFDMFRVTGGGKVLPAAPTEKAAAGDDDNSLLGNPSGASASLVMANNYLMDKGYYKLSYNRDKGTPNWVSWHVSRRDLGSMSRGNDFRPDEELPGGWYQVSESAYKGSGFDRGHNCPSGDRTATRAANAATFLMTNMIPQAPEHNQHLWKNLEEYTRALVMQGNEVYVIMGSYGSGGAGSNGLAKQIDHRHINVPDRIWKVLVVLRDGNNDLQRITKNTRIIAVNTPNSNDANHRWTAYLTTIEEIERATRYKLLDKVPEEIRQELVKKIDTGP